MANMQRRSCGHNVSLLQGKEKFCYVTGAVRGLEKHHIFFGTGLRRISDRYGFWVYLTAEKHRGTAGVHGRDGHALDLRLKQDCQRRFEQTHSRAEFMQIIGRNYLDAEEKEEVATLDEGGFFLLPEIPEWEGMGC